MGLVIGPVASHPPQAIEAEDKFLHISLHIVYRRQNITVCTLFGQQRWGLQALIEIQRSESTLQLGRRESLRHPGQPFHGFPRPT